MEFLSKDKHEVDVNIQIEEGAFTYFKTEGKEYFKEWAEMSQHERDISGKMQEAMTRHRHEVKKIAEELSLSSIC